MILEALRSTWWLLEPVLQLSGILTLAGWYAWLVGGGRR